MSGVELPSGRDPLEPLWICLNCGLAAGPECEGCGSRSVERWTLTRFWPTLRQQLEDIGGLVNLSEISRRYSVSKSTAQAWTKRPEFPAPVYRGGQETLWLAGEVAAWRQARSR